MEFRIKSIFLIPKNQEKELRVIEFALDKVNVITGGSEKGKSALIAIVDYCLGSSVCKIPTRKIRNHTEWFGLHLSLENDIEMILARKEPGESGVSGDMYLKEGLNLDIPKSLRSNYNVADVKKRLNSLSNLSDVDFTEGDEKVGFDSRPSFRDFTSFIFQPQYIIANQSSLFYRTDSMAHRQKLVSIFNYVLKAVDNQYLELKEELKNIDRELYDLNREFEKKQRSINRWLGQIRGFYTQAKEFGLLSQHGYPEDNWSSADYIIKLREIPNELEESIIPQSSLDAVAITSNRIAELTNMEVEIAYSINNLRHRQELLKNLVESNRIYRDDLLTQHGRLKSSSWFNDLLERHEEKCPFCLSETDNAKGYISNLIQTNNEIIDKGVKLNDNHTILRSELRKITQEIQSQLSKLNQIRQELNILRRDNKDENVRLNTTNSIYRFSGMIEAELANYDSFFREDSDLTGKINKLEFRKKEISGLINQEVIDNKVSAAKKYITDAIKHYANIFKAENYAETIQFNEKDLTLNFLSDTGRKDALYEIGSGSNYMAYHICTALGFHEFFLFKKEHPTPNFLMLDQPTQVYFPETDVEIKEKSEDVNRVRKIFEVLNEAVKRTQGKLQIIILEHVGEYAWTGYENIIKIKRWREDEKDPNDRALIPASWLD